MVGRAPIVCSAVLLPGYVRLMHEVGRDWVSIEPGTAGKVLCCRWEFRLLLLSVHDCRAVCVDVINKCQPSCTVRWYLIPQLPVQDLLYGVGPYKFECKV